MKSIFGYFRVRENERKKNSVFEVHVIVDENYVKIVSIMHTGIFMCRIQLRRKRKEEGRNTQKYVTTCLLINLHTKYFHKIVITQKSYF